MRIVDNAPRKSEDKNDKKKKRIVKPEYKCQFVQKWYPKEENE